MARFITYFSYTGESAKAMIDHPSDRAAAGKALVEIARRDAGSLLLDAGCA